MKKPKTELPLIFYCDNCGMEVAQDAVSCPACGRKFSSVLCPKCGFSGEESLFDSGCPSCGYEVIPGKKRAKSYDRAGRTDADSRVGRSKKEGELPFWAWAVGVGIAILTGALLFNYLFR
jgi:uncharacterized membrane protein YvbJ